MFAELACLIRRNDATSRLMNRYKMTSSDNNVKYPVDSDIARFEKTRLRCADSDDHLSTLALPFEESGKQSFTPGASAGTVPRMFWCSHMLKRGP